MSTNIRTVGLFVKTLIILQWKYMGVPDCTYIESMLMNLIQMSLYHIPPMQTILYQFEWKRLRCLQSMQRTWWQIVAMPHTGLRVHTAHHLIPIQNRHEYMNETQMPQHMQRTWWQIVAIPYSGFRVYTAHFHLTRPSRVISNNTDMPYLNA